MIALMLDISKLRVLVFGNGTVGNRKAQHFAEESAEIRIVDKEEVGTESDLESLIKTYDIIIAATDNPSFNDTVLGYAKSMNKWYNSATGKGNFLIPATFQEGDISIAVSANGKAPAAAAYIRNKIEKEWPALQKMVELQDKLRTVLKQQVKDQNRRAGILCSILEDDNIWRALEEGEIFEAEKLAWRHL